MGTPSVERLPRAVWLDTAQCVKSTKDRKAVETTELLLISILQIHYMYSFAYTL